MSWNTILRSADKPTQPLHNESRAAAVICFMRHDFDPDEAKEYTDSEEIGYRKRP